MRSEQTGQLDRVSSRISAAIVRFMRGAGRFHADELRAAVEAEVGTCAPGSADRIMRDLRQRGIIDYTLISRRGSLYEARPDWLRPVITTQLELSCE